MPTLPENIGNFASPTPTRRDTGYDPTIGDHPDFSPLENASNRLAGSSQAVLQASSDIGQSIEQGIDKVVTQQDKNAMLDATSRENQYQSDVRDYFYNPDTGVLNKQGGNAMGVGDQAKDYLQTLKDKYLEGVTNPIAARSLNNSFDSMQNAALETADRHESAQRIKYAGDLADGQISNAQNAISLQPNDDKLFAGALGQAVAATQTKGKVGGLPPEDIDANVQKTASSMWSARIRPQLYSDDPNDVMQGNAYYQKAKDAGQLSFADQVELSRVQRLAVPKAEASVALQNNIGALQPDMDIASLVPAVQNAESGGRQIDPSTGKPLTSSEGAVGVMQVMPETAQATAKAHGIAWDENKFNNDPAYNTQIGTAYLQDQQTKYGDPRLALAAYNAGPANVDKALKVSDPRAGGDYNSFIAALPKPQETGPYVSKIMGDAQAASGPQLLDVNKAQQVASKLSTPEAQQSFMSRVDTYNRQQDAQWKSQQNDVVSQIQPILDKSNGDMNAVPSELQAKAAQFGVLQKLQQDKGATNQAYKLSLDTMPTDQFSQVDLTDPQVRMNLSATDYDDYVKKQQTINSPQGKAVSHMIDTAVSSLFQLPEADPNYDPKSGTGKGYSPADIDAAINSKSSNPDNLKVKVQLQSFRNLLQAQIQDQYETTKKMPSQDDIFKMGDDLLMNKQVTIPTPGIFSRSSQTVNVLNADIKDINPNVRSYLQQGLISANKPVTPSNMTLGYKNWLTWLKTNNLTENEGLARFKGASNG